MQTFPQAFVAGDTAPVLSGQVPFDITGYTITLSLKRPLDLLVKSATIIDAPSGKFVFTWVASDLVAGVRQVAEVHFASPLGDIGPTWPQFLLNVGARNA